jgi:hypothetical protein
MIEQLTKEEAIEFHDSGKWKDMSFKQKATLQISQEKLCMPFDVFHEAVEKTIGRPVFTHEFGVNADGIRAEIELAC